MEIAHGKSKEINDIPADKWFHHFKMLMHKGNIDLNESQHKIMDFVENDKNWTIFNELNYRINSEEITKAIKALKKGKACAADLISNEMLKAGGDTMLPVLNKLFNLVFTFGMFPTLWSGSWLKPLHKGGDRSDPNKYRGISIMSCLGKLFCAVLNNSFIALIHPIQWTIANPVGADRPAKRQKKTSCVATGWPVRSTVHSPDGASYFLPV